MTTQQFRSRRLRRHLARLRAGVLIDNLVLRIEAAASSHIALCRAVIFEPAEAGADGAISFNGQAYIVSRIFDGDLKTVRKIVSAYFPFACRTFGPARLYANLF